MEMSHPSPITSPPLPSMTVNAPIQTSSPISGSPTIHACGLNLLDAIPCHEGTSGIGDSAGSLTVRRTSIPYDT